MEHHAADELHVEGPHADGAARGLARGGEGLRKNVLERLAGYEAGAQLVGARAQALVRLRRQRIRESVGLPDALRVLAQQPLVTAAEDPGEDVQHAPGTSGRADQNQGGRPKSR
jgi:hypothetical protein